MGDLNGQGTCSVPQTIVSGETYRCSFDANVSASEMGKVTASGQMMRARRYPAMMTR